MSSLRHIGGFPPPAPGKGRRSTGVWMLCVAGAAGGLLVAFGPPEVAVITFFGLGLVCPVATTIGVRRYATAGRRRPWLFVLAASYAFFCGAVLRVVVPGAGDVPLTPMAFIPDMFVVPGYLCLAYGVLGMLRRRRAAEDDPARVDAILIGLGAALVTWTLLIEPQISGTSSPPWPDLVVAFFPVIDVVLLVIAVQLLLAGGVRTPSVWLLSLSGLALFAGDLLFALYETIGAPMGIPLSVVDGVLLVFYVALSACALHPSMRTLTEPQQVEIKGLKVSRTLAISAVLCTPTVLAAVAPPVTTWNELVRTGLSLMLTVAVVFRIVRANNSRARAEDDARRQATHDALTDLPNRELLEGTVTRWCTDAAGAGYEISLLFIDLDRFKMVNDHWGHQVGDELLCAVAGRLSAIVRSEDLVCRIGGDEFVIALASPSHQRLAESLAARLVTEFSTPFTLSVGEVDITPSIGVARSAGAAEALELIRDADTAMYKAKDSGRNRYAVFDLSLRDKVRQRVDLERALRGALGRDELSVHYQPLVDMDTGELDGFEALMRWRHSELGTVSPLDFIPVAEDTGLIVPMGAWLLEEAVAQLHAWRADNPRLHVSVNLAVRQLREPGLVDAVRGILDRTGLPAEALWLEITESGVMEDIDACLAALNGLRALGITLCIDDFGTGYSSLSYLGRLPVGIVKVDREFVAGVGEGSPNESIVRAVLAMSHALGHRVVAEGVETDVQRDWLRAHRCDLGQGWLFGKPLPAPEQTATLVTA